MEEEAGEALGAVLECREKSRVIFGADAVLDVAESVECKDVLMEILRLLRLLICCI